MWLTLSRARRSRDVERSRSIETRARRNVADCIIHCPELNQSSDFVRKQIVVY